jgi:hypothetical protein
MLLTLLRRGDQLFPEVHENRSMWLWIKKLADKADIILREKVVSKHACHLCDGLGG